MKLRMLACVVAACCLLAGCEKKSSAPKESAPAYEFAEQQAVSPPEDCRRSKW